MIWLTAIINENHCHLIDNTRNRKHYNNQQLCGKNYRCSNIQMYVLVVVFNENFIFHITLHILLFMEPFESNGWDSTLMLSATDITGVNIELDRVVLMQVELNKIGSGTKNEFVFQLY